MFDIFTSVRLILWKTQYIFMRGKEQYPDTLPQRGPKNIRLDPEARLLLISELKSELYFIYSTFQFHIRY